MFKKTSRRPDIMFDLGHKVIIIEIDENQHNMYESICENKRIMELSQDVGHRPIDFIRFNPDKYTDANGKTIKSCWCTTKQGISKVQNVKQWSFRLQHLYETIKQQIDVQSTKTITVIKLYYDF